MSASDCANGTTMQTMMRKRTAEDEEGVVVTMTSDHHEGDEDGGSGAGGLDVVRCGCCYCCYCCCRWKSCWELVGPFVVEDSCKWCTRQGGGE